VRVCVKKFAVMRGGGKRAGGGKKGKRKICATRGVHRFREDARRKPGRISCPRDARSLNIKIAGSFSLFFLLLSSGNNFIE